MHRRKPSEGVVRVAAGASSFEHGLQVGRPKHFLISRRNTHWTNPAPADRGRSRTAVFFFVDTRRT